MARVVLRAALSLSCAVAVVSAVTAIVFPIPAASAPRALEAGERLDVYRETIDARWEYVAETYPDAVRPPVTFQGEVPAIEYDGRQKACLREDGMTVTEVDGGWSASAPPPLGDADLEVAFWRCQSTYAYEDTLSGLMSLEQRNALYDYTVGFLPACYAMIGEPVPSFPAPDRAEFVKQSTQFAAWSPQYDTHYSLDDPAQLRRDALCPPQPAWRTAMMHRAGS